MNNGIIATKLPIYTETQWLIIEAKKAIIASTRGKIFSIAFKKATTGELREMLCIYQQHSPEALANNPNRRLDYDQMLVQELSGNRDYPDRPRTINLATIQWIKEKGNSHVYN